MIKTKDYKKLAQYQQLELEIADLNKLREKVLHELDELEVKLQPDKVISGGRVDQETLDKELKLIDEYKRGIGDSLRACQVNDVLKQAMEGSRFVRLERKLRAHPELVQKKNLEAIQIEQLAYQKKQLEVFDYLEKHFAQFEVMDLTVALPDAGKKFFSQIVVMVATQMKDLVIRGRVLNGLLDRKMKQLVKLKRREQRELARIHDEVGKNLTDRVVGSSVLVKKNQGYQRLLQEIEVMEKLKMTLLNQINVLFDMGIEQLGVLVKKLKSIVGQNQVTRGILYQLKDNRKKWQAVVLSDEIKKRLGEFDEQISALLVGELERRYDDGEMKAAALENFRGLVEEVLEFQEYLGQVMVDSYSVLRSNLDDLERQRWEYGRLVLDFFEG
jgi:hypothetical protein